MSINDNGHACVTTAVTIMISDFKVIVWEDETDWGSEFHARMVPYRRRKHMYLYEPVVIHIYLSLVTACL